jgi:hypothetical protein
MNFFSLGCKFKLKFEFQSFKLTRFYCIKTCTVKIVCFIPYLTSHFMYYTLNAKMSFFLSLCSFVVNISKFWKDC